MKDIRQNRREQSFRHQITGWVLFVLGALFFIASSVKNRDLLTFIGSVIFLVACVIFLIPIVRKIRRTERDKKSRGQDGGDDRLPLD